MTPEQLLRATETELARRNLFEFARYTAPPEYQWGWHHALLYRYLDDFAKGKRKRLIIEAPTRHGKSEGTSRRLPAYLLGKIPGAKIALASHSLDLAEEMARDVRGIMETDNYRSVFPTAGPHEGGRSRNRADLFDIAGGGSFKAVGVGSSFTGRGFTHGIIDDFCKDRADANSAAKREGNWRWYTSVFHKRQAKDAGILITATRWHDDDLIGRIVKKMATGESEPFDILSLPAVAEPPLHPDDLRKPGEALWPWFRTAEQHEQDRLLEPRDFAAMAQQRPRAEGGTEWEASCFSGPIWFDTWPRDLTMLTVALDPSKGADSSHGDYSAIVSLGRSLDGLLWIEADMARRDTKRIVVDGLDYCDRMRLETGRPIDGFGCEANQFQELIADQFIEVSRKKGMQLPIYKITNTVSKVLRIRRLTSYITSGAFRFRNNPSTRLLVRQLEEFPIGAHDDGPDALEMALRLALELWNGSAA